MEKTQDSRVDLRVEYRGKHLAIEEVTSMRQTLVSKCQDMITSSKHPFIEKNLTTAKIFKDLYEF